MEIKASDVKALRDKTGAGSTDKPAGTTPTTPAAVQISQKMPFITR